MWKWIKENIFEDPVETTRRKINDAIMNAKGTPIPASCPMPKVKPPKPEPNPKERLLTKLKPFILEFEQETGLEIIDIMIVKYGGEKDYNILTK